MDVEDGFEPPNGLRRIDPLDSTESYADLEDFTAKVCDPTARELLARAIAGRGAFRRFKDTLQQFPDLRAAWFKFHDARMERRAIEWLRDEDVISEAEVDRALAARPDPDLPQISGPFDATEIARSVANDLRDVYGKRLRQVILFGSWARGDAHPESDIDLLVVLDRVDDPWSEHDRMDDILFRHSLENDTVVTAMPVGTDAAEAALLTLDETRSKHSGVIAAFSERLVKPGQVPRELARSLQDLFALRSEADYGYRSIPAERAASALESATRSVNVVGDWIRARRGASE